MERLQATHFIEQYNFKSTHKHHSKANEFHSTPNVLSELGHYLKSTADLYSFHTVAIFKIKFKQKL